MQKTTFYLKQSLYCNIKLTSNVQTQIIGRANPLYVSDGNELCIRVTAHAVMMTRASFPN